ncbi:unnamed protein product [Cuscuta campestris]|uniref:Uncharacterized protein n=1 Tax=Cuscuta campestris TaxID=132261 RepID=A0A484KSM1_9ASTE|nr:unnamed protein product [Cuscuta campestris]
MSSSDSQDISASDAYASEESPSSSSSTGSSLPNFEHRSVPNTTVPEPQPVNQMPGQVFQERDEPVDDEPAPYDPDNESYEGWANRLEAAGYFPLPTSYPSDIFPHVSKIAQNKIDPSLRLFLFLFEVLPGKSGCDGYVYFKGRNGRQFISDLPQSNRQWKEKFVFIKFPSISPLAGIKWNDHLLKPQYTEPASAPDLEESLEKLLQGDPFTGQMFHYGAWIWRISPGGTGTPRADEAAGHRVPAPGNTTDAGGSSHPDELQSIQHPHEEDRRLLLCCPQNCTGATGTGGDQFRGGNSSDREDRSGREDHGKPSPRQGEGEGPNQARRHHPSLGKEEEGRKRPGHRVVRGALGQDGAKAERVGEVGPETLGRLAEDSPSRSLQLEEKLKRLEAQNRELQDLTTRQLDEMANLSVVAGRANAEVLQLKEENTQLMGEVSHLKEEAWVKEQELPGRARQWMEENLVEAARVLTSSEERTMEGFKLVYREEQRKEMITQIGSYGFMSGQKRDREATHAILAERDLDFNAESYGLAPIPDEEPAPPFPLE